METFINTTSYYKNKEKGTIYRILYVHKMQHPDTGEWIPCVTYQSLTTDCVWTCSLNNFLNNFVDNFEN